MIIQFCGLSGAGKSTLAKASAVKLTKKGYTVEILDGDEYRDSLCSDLGFSKKDRSENIRRLAFVAGKLSQHGIISIICAINPYDEIRQEILNHYKNVYVAYIACSLQTLIKRDTKGLYLKALLPDNHPDKIKNMTGIDDPFEPPADPDIYINTDKNQIEDCSNKITDFILRNHQQLVVTNFHLNRSSQYNSDNLRSASL